MKGDFESYWKRWSSAQRPPIRLPGNDIAHCASVLLVLHRALVSREIHVSYSGLLINAAIRAWKVPMEQRFISKRAIAHIKKTGGKKSYLMDEHDAPVALYRDLIRYEKNLSIEDIVGYLRKLKLTTITRKENGLLERKRKSDQGGKSTRGWRSEGRPPDAYNQCGIVRKPYADYIQAARERGRARRAEVLRPANRPAQRRTRKAAQKSHTTMSRREAASQDRD